MNFFWNFGAFGSSLFVVLQLFLLIDNRVGRFKEKSLFARKSFSFGHLLFCPSPPPLSTVSPRRDANHVGMPPTRWLGMLLLGMMSKNFVGRCDFGHHTKSTYKVLCHFTFQAGVCAASLICCDFGVTPHQRYRRCFLHPFPLSASTFLRRYLPAYLLRFSTLRCFKQNFWQHEWKTNEYEQHETISKGKSSFGLAEQLSGLALHAFLYQRPCTKCDWKTLSMSKTFLSFPKENMRGNGRRRHTKENERGTEWRLKNRKERKERKLPWQTYLRKNDTKAQLKKKRFNSVWVDSIPFSVSRFRKTKMNVPGVGLLVGKLWHALCSFSSFLQQTPQCPAKLTCAEVKQYTSTASVESAVASLPGREDFSL